MNTRTNYTDAELRRFMALARGGRDSHRDRLAAMSRHPAGSTLNTGAVNMAGHRTIPRDLPHHNEETAR
ncbi:hypothetical protein [Micrococcus sp. Mcc89]|uniref:hypothetical protein n=1 Tax=Micrococcus sp. Mcc89 TaxID=2926014 RepID=UPI002117B22D|nr:hypothetical protein [Micrococcus sp. Mcc89]